MLGIIYFLPSGKVLKVDHLDGITVKKNEVQMSADHRQCHKFIKKIMS